LSTADERGFQQANHQRQHFFVHRVVLAQMLVGDFTDGGEAFAKFLKAVKLLSLRVTLQSG
jgi:hypothetical protein